MREIKKPIKVEVENETVYLKKSFDGYRVVNPNRNEDGTINWKNLLIGGNWIKFFIVMWIVIITLGILSEYASNLNTLLDCFDDPVELEICKKSFNPEAFGYGGDTYDREDWYNLSLHPPVS